MNCKRVDPIKSRNTPDERCERCHDGKNSPAWYCQKRFSAGGLTELQGRCWYIVRSRAGWEAMSSAGRPGPLPYNNGSRAHRAFCPSIRILLSIWQKAISGLRFWAVKSLWFFHKAAGKMKSEYSKRPRHNMNILKECWASQSARCLFTRHIWVDAWTVCFHV